MAYQNTNPIITACVCTFRWKKARKAVLLDIIKGCHKKDVNHRTTMRSWGTGIETLVISLMHTFCKNQPACTEHNSDSDCSDWLSFFFCEYLLRHPRSSLVFPLTACGRLSSSMNRRPWRGGKRLFDRAADSSDFNFTEFLHVCYQKKEKR